MRFRGALPLFKESDSERDTQVSVTWILECHSGPLRIREAGPSEHHVAALDGIRGIAVLAVMSSHFFPGTADNIVLRSLRIVFATGATGVDLFFVLSGFLITGILVESLAKRHFFRTFYVRRVLRIFPLYYAVLATYALCALSFGMNYHDELWSMACYLQNTQIVSLPMYAYRGPSPLPLSHFWSLAVEEQFYLVWPMLVYWIRDRWALLMLCLVATVLCPFLRADLWLNGWRYFPVHQNTLFRADSLLSGAALALLLRSSAHDRILRSAPWITLIGALVAGSLMIALSLPGSAPTVWRTVGLSLRYSGFNTLYVGFIALALQPGRFQSFCQLQALRSLGRYSYGLYVFHLIIFSYLQVPLRRVLSDSITPNKVFGVTITGTVGFMLSLLAAMASYHLYEKHFLRLKRFVHYGQ